MSAKWALGSVAFQCGLDYRFWLFECIRASWWIWFWLWCGRHEKLSEKLCISVQYVKTLLNSPCLMPWNCTPLLFFSQSWQIANNSRRFVLRCSKNSKKRPAGKCMNLKFFLCFIWGNMREGERQQDETARLARINFVSRWVLRVSHIIKK